MRCIESEKERESSGHACNEELGLSLVPFKVVHADEAKNGAKRRASQGVQEKAQKPADAAAPGWLLALYAASAGARKRAPVSVECLLR